VDRGGARFHGLTAYAAGAHHAPTMCPRTRTPPPEDSRDPPAPILGDLLYADTSQTPVLEADWIRLVQAIASGDEQALRGLFGRTNRLVFTVAMRITQNRETAEEVTLDVFHDVWRRAATYDPVGGSVVGWIMSQARSRAIDRLRREQRKKRGHGHAEGAVPSPAPRSPHDAVAVKEQGRSLRAALAVLTSAERVAIETTFFSELTYAEAAARLKQPLGTIKTRIRAGLGKLRQALGGKP
jgi:RNA polymerase sigma-70 factor (ECF subfamily)